MSSTSLATTAEEFIAARRDARALAGFPGRLPQTLDEAYAVQDEVLRLSRRRLAGWKVAGIPDTFRDSYSAERMAGPVFADVVTRVAAGGSADVHVYVGGFAAVEAEFVVVVGHDAPAGDRWLTADDISAFSTLHAGSEIASSPLATINALGPGAVISDHGNNAGAIVGPEILHKGGAPWSELVSRTYVDGELAGEGTAANVAGGPYAAVAFLANDLVRRGRRLRAGDVVLTGMTTGIHPIRPGQTARLEFPAAGHFDLRVHARQPETHDA